jgi:hypothetical protein
VPYYYCCCCYYYHNYYYYYYYYCYLLLIVSVCLPLPPPLWILISVNLFGRMSGCMVYVVVVVKCQEPMEPDRCQKYQVFWVIKLPVLQKVFTGNMWYYSYVWHAELILWYCSYIWHAQRIMWYCSYVWHAQLIMWYCSYVWHAQLICGTAPTFGMHS